MFTFTSILQNHIYGNLAMFDRMIFKGHLTSFYPKNAFIRYLSNQGVLLKNFKEYVVRETNVLKTHAKRIAAEQNRPFIYLKSATTKTRGKSKEDLALEIANKDGIKEGLICVLSVLESCYSFEVKGNPETKKLEVIYSKRKCLHFYFYLMDSEFGLMHIRLQSWFPFQIQIYINGREWLSRAMDKKGIRYKRYDNSFLWISDLEKAQELCRYFASRKWPRLLNAFARYVNPLIPKIKKNGFRSYYWVLDQGEVATDIMFKSQKYLSRIMPDLYDHSIRYFQAEDVMQFLGRKLHGNFQGEVITDHKKRPVGRRVKHWMKKNSIKMYDKASVLRIETTINNPREFKILRVIKTTEGSKRRWQPMGKGVSNIWRFFQVGSEANNRYLTALGNVELKGKALKDLENLCQSVIKKSKRYAKFNPLTENDLSLFRSVLSGAHAINGFRNCDVCRNYFEKSASTREEAKRRCARISRMIAKLRGHGLVVKLKDSNRYRISPKGYRVMSAVIAIKEKTFPDLYAKAS